MTEDSPGSVRQPDSLAGLTSAEAVRRLAETGPNELPAPRRPSLPRRMARELAQPLVVLLVVAATVSAVVLREPLDATAIAAIVVLNAAIGLLEEGRATQALDALRRMEAPRARVRRDGSTRDLPARELVPGDLIVVTAGDRIPADATLVRSEGLEVDEAVVTGESLPVTKRVVRVARDGGGVAVNADRGDGHGDGGDVGDVDANSCIAAGTLVSRGRATASVVATGPNTTLGRLAGALSEARPPTPLQRELGSVARLLGGGAVVVAAGVLGLLLVRLGGDVTAEEAFLTSVALAVAAIPEGLATVTAVALAIGVRQMAESGAIVRRLPAVETLGATTVIVFDKTGTLTENRLRLDSVTWHGGAAPGFDQLPAPVQAAAELVAALCSDTEPGQDTGDPVEQALMDAIPAGGLAELRTTWRRVTSVPFSSEQAWMGTGHQPGLAVYKGAPEVVLPRCRSWLGEHGDDHLDDDARAALLHTTTALATSGAKVLALALARDTADVEAAWAQERLQLVGLVALRDTLRPAGPASVAAAQQAGIRLVMATGDHPGTARAVADAVHLGPDHAGVRTGDQIQADGWPPDPATVPVYARISPQQKLDLVHALRARDETVAMTGDGVNDAPALHAADIGVALGRSGTDVAREASDLILTDDDLATMVEAVRRGRMIYAAIQRVVDYLVAGNLSEIILVVGVLLLYPDIGVPLLPLQLLWINLLTDGAPAIALGIDNVDDGVLGRPPRTRDRRLLDRPRWGRLVGRGALLASAPVAAVSLGRGPFDLDIDGIRTMALTVLVVAHLLYAVVLSPRFSPRSWAPWAVALGLGIHALALLTPPGRALLHLQALPVTAWPLILTLGLAPVLLLLLTPKLRQPM